MPNEKVMPRPFEIPNFPCRLMWWLSRCSELEGAPTGEIAKAILEREWRRCNESASARSHNRINEEPSTHQH